MERAFKCANKLLKEGMIAYVFFAADSMNLVNMARKYISMPQRLIEIPDKLQHYKRYEEGDNYDMRDSRGMHTAVLEWYLVGEADFCMSASIYTSTFSKTAVARGRCKYLHYHAADECVVDKLNPLADKEILLKTRSAKQELLVEIPRVRDEDVWESIRKYRQVDKMQCTHKEGHEDVDEDAVIDFWSAAARYGESAVSKDPTTDTAADKINWNKYSARELEKQKEEQQQWGGHP
jgi:hypothetical protein